MSITNDAFTNSDAASMITEEWSNIVVETPYPHAVLSSFVTDLSEFVDSQGDIVHVPSIYNANPTVNSQSTQGAEVSTNSPSDTDNTFSVGTHKYVAFLFGDKTIAQLAKNYQLQEKYAKEAKALLVQELEDSLFGQWSNLSTNTIGDTATAVTDLEIRDAIESLETLDEDPQMEGAFFFHPTPYWKQILGIQKYYEKDISGFTLVENGRFPGAGLQRSKKGELYDIPLMTSSRVVSGLQTYRNLLLLPECFAFAVQLDNRMSSQQMESKPLVRVQSSYELTNLGNLTVADILYGTDVIQEEKGVLVNANTSATTT